MKGNFNMHNRMPRLRAKVTRKLRRLLDDILRIPLQRRVEKRKRSRAQLRYQEQPKTTFIIQSFNKRKNLRAIVEALREGGADEIIGIDDGSIDNSHEEWMRLLDQPNDFLLRCNDLYEVRTYDRAIRMAKGEYVCLLQDDDIPPKDGQWIRNALRLLDGLPTLLILGGRSGLELFAPDPVDAHHKPEYKRTGDIAGCPGVNKYRMHDHPIFSAYDMPFMFVMAINRAPMFIRRHAFLELGGIDPTFAPFQCDDIDTCLKAWLHGYQVGLYAAPFLRDVGKGGMRSFNAQGVSAQAAKNWGEIYRRYGRHLEGRSLQLMVDSANTALVSLHAEPPRS